MKRYMVWIVISLSCFACAKKEVPAPPEAPVPVVSPSSIPAELEFRKAPVIPLPNNATRELFFTNAGVAAHIKTLDGLDRDLLYQRAGRLPLREMQRRYPDIPKENLKALRQNVLDHEIQKHREAL